MSLWRLVSDRAFAGGMNTACAMYSIGERRYAAAAVQLVVALIVLWISCDARRAK